MPQRLQRYRIFVKGKNGSILSFARDALTLTALMADLFFSGIHPSRWVAIQGE